MVFDYIQLLVCHIFFFKIHLYFLSECAESQLEHMGSSLWHAGSLVVACKYLTAACGIQFSKQGSNSGPLHWEYGVLATGPPGKSLPFLVHLSFWHLTPSVIIYIFLEDHSSLVLVSIVNFFRQYLSQNALILPLYLKDRSTEQIDQLSPQLILFPPCTLKILLHTLTTFLLACKLSVVSG